MRYALDRLRKKVVFHWVEVDIDRDTALICQFDTLVPALYYRERELCHHFIDEEAIRSAVNSPD